MIDCDRDWDYDCDCGAWGDFAIKAIQYKLRTCPAWIKSVYTQKVRFGKDSTYADRKDFLEHLLADDIDADYFNRFRQVESKQSSGELSKWLSWKALLDQACEEVAKAGIASGAIEHREHPSLNHELPETRAMDWYVRHQYKHNVDVEEHRSRIAFRLIAVRLIAF